MDTILIHILQMRLTVSQHSTVGIDQNLLNHSPISQSSLPLNNTSLNCEGLLICIFFSINILKNILEVCNNLKKSFF